MAIPLSSRLVLHGFSTSLLPLILLVNNIHTQGDLVASSVVAGNT